MTDKALENALAKQAALESKLSALNQELQSVGDELAEVGRFIALWHKFSLADTRSAVSSDVSRDVSGHDSTHLRVKGASTRRPPNPKKEAVGEAVREVIAELKRPVPRPELMERLRERGIVLVGKDPEKVLSTMLWRLGDRVTHFPRLGYWLADEPLPERVDPDYGF